MSTDFKRERPCPHCSGKLAKPAQGFGLAGLTDACSSAIEHQESCPLRVRAKRLNSLATGFLGASLLALSVPGCYQAERTELERNQDAFGLDNGTVGAADIPPGKDAA